MSADTIDQMCRKALRNLKAHVRVRVERERDRIAEQFRAARRARRLPPYALLESMYLRLPPRFECPECGSRLFMEVDEWGTADGIPTPGGIRVICEADEADMWRAMNEDLDRDNLHRNWQSDWQPVTDQVARWAASRVRVYRP